jgi:hypothetical protein
MVLGSHNKLGLERMLQALNFGREIQSVLYRLALALALTYPKGVDIGPANLGLVF